MPATLLSAKIRGVRSYSPSEEASQTVDFMPLTLIVGSNGTGKTTIIEALKFIISGEEPPHSDSRRNFIHTTKSDRSFDPSGACASIEIRFKNSSSELCIARRDISRAGTGRNTTPSITSSYKIGGNVWVTIHKQDDWNKLMPKLFGLPNQAILSNVILCHQEDNNWCMGESSCVKQVFDKIFGCEQYKKEIRHIDDEIRSSKKDLAMSEKDIQLYGEKVRRKKAIAVEIKRSESELEKSRSNIENLDSDISKSDEKRKFLTTQISEFEIKSRELSSLRQRISELKERDSLLRRSLQPFINRRKDPPPPIKKKQTSDPTAADLSNVIENLGKMSIIVEKLEQASVLDDLKNLLKITLARVETIRSRFSSPIIEEPAFEAANEEESDREKVFKISIENDIKENLQQIELIKATISTIEEQFNNDENLNIAKQDLKEIEIRLMTLRDKRSRLAGTRIQLEREMSRLKVDFTNYKKANTQYAESLGKFVCNEVIISDLEKLKQCFQDSITKFHDQMILKINEALRSRWRQIYQGTDIDSIELVDEEITRGKDKKSFNYFMAMRKNGTRMKMREKSSAGQRALASIILRMTLAELFVRDFAFIAFDEPTANLDLGNVQALARSIGAYVRRRNKKGAHIQWIIITHDEQFLRALDEECSPYFYRTEMDQNGFSIIVKKAYHDADLVSQVSSL